MSKVRKLMFIAPLAILGIAIFVAIGGKVVMDLWNYLLPPLFGWRAITLWQALGVLALCRVLFGGHGWRSPCGSKFCRRMPGRFGHMTPAERERFRQRMRERCGFGPSPVQSKGL